MCLSAFLAGTSLCPAGERSWIEVKSPNFTVFSDSSEKAARQTAHRFELFRQAMRILLPKHRIDSGIPFYIFAARNGGSYRSLLPEEARREGAIEPQGMFIESTYGEFIVKNYVLLRNDLSLDQAYHIIYHEYVHRIMRLNFQNLPLWLSEGFAEFYANAEILDKSADIGKSNRSQLYILINWRMLPMEILLSDNPREILVNDRTAANIFYAQSWILTHYLMMADNRAHIQKLAAFITHVQNGKRSLDAAVEAFGDLGKLKHQIEEYAQGVQQYQRIPLELEMNEKDYATRTLSGAESLAVRGMLFAETDRMDDGRVMLEQSLEMEPRNLMANEGMGVLHLRRGERDEALRYLNTAAELGSGNFLVHFYAALDEYRKGSDYDGARVEASLRRALELNPKFVPTYNLLSFVLVGQKEKQSEALAMAGKAVELAPLEFRYHVDLGRILLAMDQHEEACSYGQKLVAQARTAVDRQMARSFLSTAEGFLNETRPSEQPMLDKPVGYGESVEESDDWKEKWEEQNRLIREANLPVETGPPGEIQGLVRSVKCKYPAVMDVVIASGENLHSLRARNYYDVAYWFAEDPGLDEYDPCRELEGKHVKIGYITALKQEYSGLIEKIEVGSSDISTQADPEQ